MKKNKKVTLKDIVYQNYNKLTNMTSKELRLWKKNPISKNISRNRKPISMAIRLKSKSKDRWGMAELKWALKSAIPYIKRARKLKSRVPIKGTKYTRKQIALKNWGLDIRKGKGR